LKLSYFFVKGEGALITLCFAALKESASTRRGKTEAKELLSDLSVFFSLGEEGVSTYEASPSFTSRFALVTV